MQIMATKPVSWTRENFGFSVAVGTRDTVDGVRERVLFWCLLLATSLPSWIDGLGSVGCRSIAGFSCVEAISKVDV